MASGVPVGLAHVSTFHAGKHPVVLRVGVGVGMGMGVGVGVGMGMGVGMGVGVGVGMGVGVGCVRRLLGGLCLARGGMR